MLIVKKIFLTVPERKALSEKMAEKIAAEAVVFSGKKQALVETLAELKFYDREVRHNRLTHCL